MTNLETKRLHVDRWTINAALAGEGRPILFLHGLGMSWEWWRPTMDDLSDRYTVCAIDLPGWGGSSGMDPPQSGGSYRALVDGIIQSLGLGPTVVVGHSLGGYTAVRAASAGTTRIQGLLLVAPGGFGQIHNLWLRLVSFPVLGELAIRTGALGSRIFMRSVVYDPSSISNDMLKLANIPLDRRKEFVRELRMGIQLGRTTAAYLVETPVELQVPVQMVWGRHDRVLPVEIAYTAQRVLGAGPPVIFEHSGHLPQIEERGQFKAVVDSFCSHVWRD